MEIALGAKCHLVVKDGKTTYRGYDLDELADSYHELQKLKEKEGPRRTVKFLGYDGLLFPSAVTFEDVLTSRNNLMEMFRKAEKELKELKETGRKVKVVTMAGHESELTFTFDQLLEGLNNAAREVVRLLGEKEKSREPERRTVKILTNGGDLVDQNVTFQELLFSRNVTMEMLLKAEKEIEELKKTPLQLRDEYCKELWDKIVNTKKPATLLARDGMTLFAGICDQCQVPVHYTGARSRQLLGMPNLTNLWSDWRVYESKPDVSNAVQACRDAWQK